MSRTASSGSLVIGGPPRVDLMPAAELERRFRRTMIRRWVLGLIAAAVVVGLVIAGAGALRVSAELRLAAERERTDALIADIASLADVADTVRTSRELTSYRAETMTADLEWLALLDALLASLPAGVTVIGFDVDPGAGPTDEEPADAAGPILELTLASAAPFDILSAIRGVRGLPTVLDADGWELTYDDSKSRFTYLLSVTATQEAYSGRYAEEADE